MFSLTASEATALCIGLLATVLLLVAGVLVAFPRGTRVFPARVDCPLGGGRASVEFVRDEWTLRFVDVARCSRLSGYTGVICAKRCLASNPAAQLPRAA